MNILLISLSAFLLYQQNEPATVRARLFDALDRRRPQNTSRVVWSLTQHQGTQAGLTHKYVHETYGEQYRIEGLQVRDASGDGKFAQAKQAAIGRHRARQNNTTSGGYLNRRMNHRQLKTDYSRPTEAISFENQVLFYEAQAHSIHASGEERPQHPVRHPRTFGMGPALSKGKNDLGIAGLDLDEESWLESPDGSRISAFTKRGYRIDWELDPHRDDQPVSVRLFAPNGLLHSRSETTLQYLEKRWYPKSVSYYSQCSDEEQLDYVISVEDATFDIPSHRQEPWTPSDIGPGFGIPVASSSSAGVLVRFWDGTAFLLEEEFRELTFGYGVPLSPEVIDNRIKSAGGDEKKYYQTQSIWKDQWLKKHEQTHGFAHPGSMPLVPDDWDVYVDQFIQEHSLDQHRSEIAKNLLERAKKLRNFYRAKRPISDGRASYQRIAKELARIERRIFDTLLVRGLNKLVPRSR